MWCIALVVTVGTILQGVDTTRAINKSFRWIIPFLFITVGLSARAPPEDTSMHCASVFLRL